MGGVGVKWERERYSRQYERSYFALEPRFGVAGGWRGDGADAFTSELLLAWRIPRMPAAIYLDAASIRARGWHDYFGRYALHIQAEPFNYGVVAEQVNGDHLGGLRLIIGSIYVDRYWVLAGSGSASTRLTVNISF